MVCFSNVVWLHMMLLYRSCSHHLLLVECAQASWKCRGEKAAEGDGNYEFWIYIYIYTYIIYYIMMIIYVFVYYTSWILAVLLAVSLVVASLAVALAKCPSRPIHSREELAPWTNTAAAFPSRPHSVALWDTIWVCLKMLGIPPMK